MDRRNALRIFGALFICLAGKPVITMAGSGIRGKLSLPDDIMMGPTNYTFSGKGMGNITIEKINGEKLIIPFSEIIRALET